MNLGMGGRGGGGGMPLDERDKDGKERGGVSLMSGIDKLCNRCENCAFREGKVAVTTDTQTRTDREKDALHADGRTTVGARVGERMDRVCLLYTKSDSQRNFRIGPSDTVLKQMERMAHKTSRDQKYILNQFSFSILANFQVNESESYFFATAATATADIGIQLTPQNSPRTIKMLSCPLCLSFSVSIFLLCLAGVSIQKCRTDLDNSPRVLT